LSTPTTIQQPAAPHSALRRLVARHPVAAFLIMVFALTYGTALVPFLTQRAILPFGLTHWATLIGLFCCAPAFLVVAATHGRAGVRDLARRSLRWRVGPQWYFVALLGLPIATVLCASALFGLAPLQTLIDKWLLGGPGAFLALPITLFVAVMLDTFPETRWLASIIGVSSPDTDAPHPGAEVERTV
jgi:uncharacterized protein